MARAGPPAYAWDWFARQRLLWREARSRLAASATPAATRYHAVESRAEVVAMLRADYARDAVVRDVVHAAVRDVAFLGRTSGRFVELGLHQPPRGLRWWWSALTGEELDGPTGPPAAATRHDDIAQLSLDDVHQGYGG